MDVGRPNLIRNQIKLWIKKKNSKLRQSSIVFYKWERTALCTAYLPLLSEWQSIEMTERSASSVVAQGMMRGIDKALWRTQAGGWLWQLQSLPQGDLLLQNYLNGKHVTSLEGFVPTSLTHVGLLQLLCLVFRRWELPVSCLGCNLFLSCGH